MLSIKQEGTSLVSRTALLFCRRTYGSSQTQHLSTVATASNQQYRLKLVWRGPISIKLGYWATVVGLSSCKRTETASAGIGKVRPHGVPVYAQCEDHSSGEGLTVHRGVIRFSRATNASSVAMLRLCSQTRSEHGSRKNEIESRADKPPQRSDQ